MHFGIGWRLIANACPKNAKLLEDRERKQIRKLCSPHVDPFENHPIFHFIEFIGGAENAGHEIGGPVKRRGNKRTEN